MTAGRRNRTIRTTDGLIAAGLAPAGARAGLDAVAKRYAVAITPAMLGRIEAADDPVARQFVPDAREIETLAHELADPIGDAAHSPVKGVVRRYPDRALLKPLLSCPVYCRFCFRRERVGPGGGLLSEAELEAALAWLAANADIREVILTGGDPLMLSPRRLGAILRALEGMAHVELLRIHSRVPLVAPELVTEGLAAALGTGKALWLAVHANHAREFSPAGEAALRRLAMAGVPMLGQSVLLRGVNDSAEALADLFGTMLRHRIKPYYLHQLDPAPGTARFAVPIAEGQAIMRRLRGRISGMAWPTYVLDIAGGHGKVPIGPAYLDGATVADPWGGTHRLAGAGGSV